MKRQLQWPRNIIKKSDSITHEKDDILFKPRSYIASYLANIINALQQI